MAVLPDLAIKCATHSGSNVGRKIWGRVCPRPIPLGFHAFHKPDFPPSQISLCVAGFMTRFACSTLILKEILARKEAIMKTIRAFIKRHPVLSYYALVFAISWGGILLVIGLGPGGIPATKEQVGALMPFMLLALFAGPSVAGLVMTGLVYGREGFRNLLTRMTRWRVGARWYAVALLTAPLTVMATLLSLSLTSPEFLPSIFTSDDKVRLLLFGIGWGLVGGGLLEELGWTGFAVPTLLRQRHGVLATGLLWCGSTTVPVRACSWRCSRTRVSQLAC